MTVPATPGVPPISAEHRRIAAERFDRANQVVAGGNFDYAIQLLLACCKLDPTNMLYRQTLRRTQKGKYRNNLRGSRLALLTTIRTRGRMKTAKRNREFQKVLEHGEEILSRNPWDQGVQMDMAEAADSLGLLDMAIFLLDQARQKNPKDPTLNRALARLFEKRGNFSHAIALWQQVREANPADVEAAHKAKDLAASETIQRGNYDQSSSGERPALNSSPASGPKSDGTPIDRSTRETAALQSRIDANPTDPSLYVQLAAVHRRQNQADKARAVLEQGQNATGNAFVIQVEILEMALEPFRRNLTTAEEKIRQAAKRKADDFDDDGPSIDELKKIRHKLLKEILAREIEIFRLRADRFPQDLSHRIELGQRLLKVDRVDEAIIELQMARKEPKYLGRATMYLGFCFNRRKNWRLAQRNFEEALEHIPATEEADRKEVMYQLATGHAESGDLAKAIDLGHELANLDFSFRNIGKLLDDWQDRVQQA